MSLDITLIENIPTEVWWANITHNLNKMAQEATLYYALWRPEEIGIIMAEDLIPILGNGLEKLLSYPEYYKQFNPQNGWGNYDSLVHFTRQYLDACRKYPDAKIEVSR